MPGYKKPPPSKGRKAGVPNRINMAARLRVEQEADPVGILIAAAKTGKVTIADVEQTLDPDQFMAVVRELRRIQVPDAKSATIRMELPAIETAADLMQAIGAVVAEMAAGHITTDEALAVASVIETKRKAMETVDIERRLSRLEGHSDLL